MDPINQVSPANGGSKKGLYIVIGILVVLLIGGYFYMHRNSSVENMYGVDVRQNLDGSKTITSPYGTATTSDKLTKDWPSDAPVYANGTISQSSSTEMMKVATFTTSDDFQTILDFYKKELTASGWVSMSPGKPITGTQTGSITMLGAKKGNRSFSVTIMTNKETGKQVVNVGIVTIPDPKDYKTGL